MSGEGIAAPPADGEGFLARHAMGARVEGLALVAADGFSARYDLDRLRGVFSRPQHALAGRSYVDRILVLETAKGGVASAWMLREMRERGLVPLALVFNSVNPIIAQGTAFAGIPMLAGFDVDVTAAFATGDRLVVDPARRRVWRVPAP
jgi:predicted aconitase with swiveling domain